ncbi:MAG: carbohydrate-binding family 9-like protein [Caldilineaceae bacterium]
MPHSFPCPEDRIARYTAYARTPPRIDGRLDEACWQSAPRSPRFVDLISGKPTVHATHAAVLWDDDNLYVGFWVEEPFVGAFLTERDAPIYTDNDVEVFIAGQDAYYEFEINAFGTVYEVFYVWEEAYDRGNFSRFPGLQRNAPGIHPFNGVGFTNHPRGPRLGFAQWDFPACKAPSSWTGRSTSTMTATAVGRWNWPSPGRAWKRWRTAMGGPCRRGPATPGAWTFRASTSTKKRPPPTTPAAGRGHPTASGIRMCRSASSM